MTLRTIVKLRYKNILPLEATCIAGAIRDKQWDDFKHSLVDRLIFTIASIFCKGY